MNVLIIQENGRHDGNRNFRECFCAQRAFIHHGHAATVWGLGHSNYEERPDYQSYDLIINLENYEKTVYPHFDLFDFASYNKIETITCPNYGTVWEVRFLRKK